MNFCITGHFNNLHIYRKSTRKTLNMTAGKVGLILLLLTSLYVRKVPSQCMTTEFCLLRNIRGISVYNSSRSRRSMSMTCIRACWLHPGCVVTTYDSATENCELHETGAEGTPPVTLVNNDGSSVWFIKHPQRSCLKVSFNFKLLSTLSVC